MAPSRYNSSQFKCVIDRSDEGVVESSCDLIPPGGIFCDTACVTDLEICVVSFGLRS